MLDIFAYHLLFLTMNIVSSFFCFEISFSFRVLRSKKINPVSLQDYPSADPIQWCQKKIKELEEITKTISLEHF